MDSAGNGPPLARGRVNRATSWLAAHRGAFARVRRLALDRRRASTPVEQAEECTPGMASRQEVSAPWRHKAGSRSPRLPGGPGASWNGARATGAVQSAIKHYSSFHRRVPLTVPAGIGGAVTIRRISVFPDATRTLPVPIPGTG